MSNAGGVKSLNRYSDMLAGNTVWNPWEPAGAYDALATVTVPSGGVASVTFAGIPAGYKHLQIRATQLNTATATTNLRVNADSGSNYSRHYLYGGGSSATGAAGSASQTSIGVLYNESTTYPAVSVIDILDYASVTKNKTVRSLMGWDANGSGYVFLYSGSWMNSSTAITSLTFTPDGGSLAQNTIFALYGVK
jgi:hypothetical protein